VKGGEKWNNKIAAQNFKDLRFLNSYFDEQLYLSDEIGAKISILIGK
jgi:hypothetical protein